MACAPNDLLPLQDIITESAANGYGDQLLQRLGHFWRNKLFCDLTLRVESASYQVHRLVLAACSDYFEALFSHNMQERHSSCLDLPSVEASGFEPLLHFAYTGNLPLTLLNVENILPAAAFLQITAALQAISDFLKSKMTFDNAKRLVNLGEHYGLIELRSHLKEMILTDFTSFAETELFLELSPMELTGYLMEDCLNVPNELTLLKCVLRWYHADVTNREEHIADVLDKIRYTLDGWSAVAFARKTEPFISNRQCREILSWCERYLQNPFGRVMLQSYRTRVRSLERSLVQVGGIRQEKNDPFPGFVLPDDDEVPEERTGCMLNRFYHRTLQKWMPLGEMEATDAMSHCPLVEVNDFAVLVGGYLYTTDFNLGRYQHCSNEVRLIQAGCGFASWDLPCLLGARAHHTAVFCQNYIYAIGGKNESGNLSSVERYSLEEEEWSYVEELPVATYDHASCVMQDQVYVCGGTQKGRVVNDVLCFVPCAEEWTSRPPLLTARTGHAMAAIGDEILVCGGSTALGAHYRCLASVESFNVRSQQWTFIKPMRQDCCSMTAVVLDSKLLLVGGENSVGDLLTQVQEFDPKSETWGTYCSLPTAMKSVGCCALTVKLTDAGKTAESEKELNCAESDDDYPDDDNDDDDDDDVLRHLQHSAPFNASGFMERIGNVFF